MQSKECRNLKYDYYLILDSDEIIPENFIVESLRYFYTYTNIGIVQANHISTNNRNFFMKTFHIGVNSHWPTYQIMKNYFGFSTMLGHGALVKKECYENAGGFPNLVAEDLCLSIKARAFGYYVAFAPNIICEEEYPVDYLAFKKRHSKWTQGNFEFIKKFTGTIVKSKMKWFEKMDIILFTYNLPLTAIFAFHLFANIIILPLVGVDISKLYSPYLIIPTLVFFLSPMFNDFFTWIFRLSLIRNLWYSIWVVVLYGSMLLTSLISAFLGIFGKKAKFIVTPKDDVKYGFWDAIKIQWKEILFAIIIAIPTILVWGNPLPVILIVLTSVLSFFLIFFSNKRYSKEQTLKNDEKTKQITLKINPLFIMQNNLPIKKTKNKNIKVKNI